MMSNVMWRRACASAKLAAVGAVVGGVMAFSAPAHAAILLDNIAVDPAINELFIGYEAVVDIRRLTTENNSTTAPHIGGGELLFKFEAKEPLTALEVSTLAPTTIFVNPYIAWLEDDGLGGFSVVQDMAGSQLNSNNQPTSMAVALSMGDLIWLKVKWDEIKAAGNWDINISAVPLPPALLLFLSGLAGIGFLGRVKSKRRERAIAVA